MRRIILLNMILFFAMVNCREGKKREKNMSASISIAFLHHSTGDIIWRGGTSKLSYKLFKNGDVSKWFSDFNKKHQKNYQVESIFFPRESPYGWKNYPFDYYNIWVNHQGEKAYLSEPTLEILSKNYQVIVLKHCFPASNILEDDGNPDVNSEKKTLQNYKLQYEKIKEKMKSFPNTKFLIWTAAALPESKTTKENAERAREFKNWVVNEWDEPNDNIFTWDFFELETEGGLYLKTEYAQASGNPHPNIEFAKKAAPIFCQRIVDIIEKGI